MATKRIEPPPKRNFAAQAAKNQKAGPIKDKREGRGGAKNTFRIDISEKERG